MGGSDYCISILTKRVLDSVVTICVTMDSCCGNF